MAAAALWSSLAPAMAETNNALVNAGLSIWGTHKQQQYNKDLAALQNQYNIDMWRMNNEYNSPAAQMRRYEEAGLNPNLIYGQGTPGNSSTPPQMVAPEAVRYDKMAEKVAKAFNIQNLLAAMANTSKSFSEAEIAKVQAEREKAHLQGDTDFGQMYSLDQRTGQFVSNVDPDSRSVTVYKYPLARYYTQQHLHDNVVKAGLLVPRAQYLQAQSDYLQPQILMRQYEQRMQPYSFWIGQGSKILNSLPFPKLKFERRKMEYHHNY